MRKNMRLSIEAAEKAKMPDVTKPQKSSPEMKNLRHVAPQSILP